MNKYIEAFKKLKTTIWKLSNDKPLKKDLEPLYAIHELVEKATPKKPRYNKEIDEYTCRECGYNVIRRWEKMNYCPHCGQSIDWENKAILFYGR